MEIDLRGIAFPFLYKDECSYLEVLELQEAIELYCKVCSKGFKVKYIPTGNDDTLIMENTSMKCHYCKRVLRLKKYTEKILLANSVNNRVYI